MKNASAAIGFPLCAMKLLLFAFAFSCLLPKNNACAQNHATADITGVCCQGEVHIGGGQDFGPLSATVQYNSDNDASLISYRNEFLVTGNASVDADQGHNVINLRTQVTAQRRADTSSAYLTAETFWVDHITLSNPQNLVIPADGFIGFFGTVTGNLTGQSSAFYQIQVGSGPESDHVEFSASTPGTYNSDIQTNGAAGVHISQVMMNGLDLSVHLSVSAVDTPSGSADFGSTAKFIGFKVVDANGNPVPNADKLVFTGNSGFIYPVVQTVPEPRSLSLLGLSLLGSLAFRRRKLNA